MDNESEIRPVNISFPEIVSQKNSARGRPDSKKLNRVEAKKKKLKECKDIKETRGMKENVKELINQAQKVRKEKYK